MDISEWLTKKFLEWQSKSGERRTLVDFAEYLEVTQPSLSNWMSGKYLPRGSKNINKLYEKLGPEIFDVLGIEKPAFANQYLDEAMTELASSIAKIPEAHREETKNVLLDILNNFINGTQKSRLSNISKEDLQETVEILKKSVSMPSEKFLYVNEDKENYNKDQEQFR